MTLYELATLDILPSNGPLWHELREGSLQIRLSACLSRYSRSFIKVEIEQSLDREEHD